MARLDKSRSAQLHTGHYQQHEGQYRTLPGRRHHRGIPGGAQWTWISDYILFTGIQNGLAAYVNRPALYHGNGALRTDQPGRKSLSKKNLTEGSDPFAHIFSLYVRSEHQKAAAVHSHSCPTYPSLSVKCKVHEAVHLTKGSVPFYFLKTPNTNNSIPIRITATITF